MGNCSIPRSNPGGGAERIGDIKVTTRTSLGNKWVLCNGDPIPGAEIVTPDITKEEFWTNINGLPAEAGGYAVEPSKAIYAKDGYWLVPVYDGSTMVDVFKYNHNTGEFASDYSQMIDTTQDIVDFGVLYDIITDKILVYHCYEEDNDFAFVTETYAFEHDSSISSETTIYDILSLNDIIDRDSVHNISGRAIAFYYGSFYYEGTIGYNQQSGSYGDCYDYYYVLANNNHIIKQSNTSSDPENYSYTHEEHYTDAFNIENSLYIVMNEACCENVSWQTYFNIDIYIISILDGGDPLLDTSLELIGHHSYILSAEYESITSETCPDSTGTYFYTACYKDGYMEVYRTSCSIKEDQEAADMISLNTFSEYSFDEAGMIFCCGKSMYLYSTSFANVSCVLTNIEDLSSTNINNTIPELDKNSIRRSNIVFARNSNGSDKYYFFDGNDQTERLPIITVDEEAYCFMKIKE